MPVVQSVPRNAKHCIGRRPITNSPINYNLHYKISPIIYCNAQGDMLIFLGKMESIGTLYPHKF